MERTVVDNRYALSGLLGGGGMGKVYLACDMVLDRDVALKVLREQYAEDEGFVERFEREAKAAASLNHPHIVQVYDRGRTGDGYYIAMEHVPGGTLKDRILGGGRLGADEAVRLASQIADALGTAHAGGIVHRDVKPHNVLLTAAGDAKVADFGIARAASEAPISNSSLVLGTAKYMSPEQAMGDRLGPESDLYSLGVVLYEMLTGDVPFDADSAVGVAMKHVNEPPRPPGEANPAVPAGLEAVTMKLLRKKPEDRYSGAPELVADLRRVGEDLSPVFAPPAASQAETEETETERIAAPTPAPGSPGGARRAPRRPSRKGTRLLAAALAALLALIGLAGVLLSGAADGPVVGSLGEAAEEAQRALGVGEGQVPGVVGLTEREARERLAAEGFGVAVERRASPGKDEGKVLEQSVSAGEGARRGSRIALAVGGGPRAVEVPDLVGLTPERAKDELGEAGLELGESEGVQSGGVPEGQVAAQDPRVGEETAEGAEVDLKISSGPPAPDTPDRVEVPGVSGLGVGAATAALEEAGCEVAGTREEPGPEPAGTVLGTDPPAGTAVASGAPVTLVVSGGPGAPRADAGSDPGAAPAPSASATASATASPGASDPPEPPPGQDPPAEDARPSSPEPPAPSSPAPASPPPSSSPEPSSPGPSSPEAPTPEAPTPEAPSPGSAPPSPSAAPSSAAPSSPSPSSPAPASASVRSGEEGEDAEVDEAGEDE